MFQTDHIEWFTDTAYEYLVPRYPGPHTPLAAVRARSLNSLRSMRRTSSHWTPLSFMHGGHEVCHIAPPLSGSQAKLRSSVAHAAPSTGAAAITGSPRDLLVAMLINTSGPAPLDSTATQGARWACSYRRPRCTSHSMRSENNQGHTFQLAQATTQIHCSLLQRVPVQDCGPHLCSFDRIAHRRRLWP